MKTVAKIDDGQIEQMELTISVTMTVEEWRNVMRDLSQKYPMGKLAQHIAGMLGHVSKMSSATITEGQ
jgi:cell division protein FtsI/penicillin-binding protein 2